MSCITKHTFTFLKNLKKNNTKPWFEAHRADYEQSHAEVLCFVEKLQEAMQAYDVIEPVSPKRSLMRIYRDIRFSKDKTPYKIFWGGSLKRAGAERRGGMVFRIQPGNSYIAGGFWAPNKEDLLHIRRQIAADPGPLRDVLGSKAFKNYFGALYGEQLKTAPKGFDKEHPDIDLLNYKQFLVKHMFTDKEVLQEDYVEQVAKGFSNMQPFFDAMTEYLTTDLNGVSLL